MNLDGKRSVNNILSSFCPEGDETVGRHISSIGEPNDNIVEIVLDGAKHFTVNTSNLVIGVIRGVSREGAERAAAPPKI